MNYDATTRTFDCDPTLTDSEVLDFCINGCIMTGGCGARRRWPWRTENQIDPSWGYGRTEGYLPDWRDGNRDGYSR